jgi:PadR family transcriptional regulator AphA
MAKENKTQYAILGILGFGPMSGYDIKKFVDMSIGFFWNENFGHIYPILNRLEKEGLVEKREVTPRRGPRRNVYSLTAAGKDALIAWLKSTESERAVRNELLLRIFFGNHLSTGELRETLLHERKQQEARLEAFAEVRDNIENKYPGSDEEKRNWLITLEYGIMKSKMTIRWVDQSLKKLE